MKIQTVLLGTAVLTLTACSSYNHSASGPRYVPRAEIADRDYTLENHNEDYRDKKSYNRYEQREPCQNYRELPRNMTDRCATTDLAEVSAHQVVTKRETLLPVINSYTILFDFDKSDIRSGEMATISHVVREMEKYNPAQVTVTGYTDSAGKAGYNQTLSRQREQAVSRLLLERGIKNQTIDRAARGEYDQAVDTADGVKNQENRRVVIDFRR